ncbi:hypothetical protein UFOVP376_15 [uncultured Caudovirales phage]|uniref:Uncharacterized protein n=1 Tax=uncultured Caudovirales phage TaxID=2100421 RepID=A0A6J7X0Y1_9CAUD|nr:hypothetical protein UFOVP376_15 [uncultured Caudovirales phage]
MKKAISLTDLIEIQTAFLILYQLVNEVHLSASQFDRKMDCITGRVVLDRVMQSLNAEFEVTA